MNKTYLGDSVYAQVLHGELILTTENGGPPSNRIVLEAEVCQSLVDFLAKFGITYQEFGSQR